MIFCLQWFSVSSDWIKKTIILFTRASCSHYKIKFWQDRLKYIKVSVHHFGKVSVFGMHFWWVKNLKNKCIWEDAWIKTTKSSCLLSRIHHFAIANCKINRIIHKKINIFIYGPTTLKTLVNDIRELNSTRNPDWFDLTSCRFLQESIVRKSNNIKCSLTQGSNNYRAQLTKIQSRKKKQLKLIYIEINRHQHNHNSDARCMCISVFLSYFTVESIYKS